MMLYFPALCQSKFKWGFVKRRCSLPLTNMVAHGTFQMLKILLSWNYTPRLTCQLPSARLYRWQCCWHSCQARGTEHSGSLSPGGSGSAVAAGLPLHPPHVPAWPWQDWQHLWDVWGGSSRTQQHPSWPALPAPLECTPCSELEHHKRNLQQLLLCSDALLDWCSSNGRYTV